MEITQRRVGDITILDIRGKMTLHDGDCLLRNTIRRLVNQGDRKIILNLGNTPYIDSAGLGEISRSWIALSRLGGQVKLLSLSKRIEDLLSITKLLTVFETFEDEEKAIKSFRT